MKLSSAFYSHDEDLSWLDIGKIKKAQREARVKYMWTQLVSEIILDHTNGIYIFYDRDTGKKILQVYVDDSLFASELNASRELLRLQYLEQYNEKIDEFRISVSHGRHKSHYPFRKKKTPEHITYPLTASQREQIKFAAAKIPDPGVRAHFERAMTADLERNNIINDENDPRNL